VRVDVAVSAAPMLLDARIRASCPKMIYEQF
jgi:hypothetical protein